MFKEIYVICKKCDEKYNIYVTGHTLEPLGAFICPHCGAKYTK
jgi:hypothetical protein